MLQKTLAVLYLILVVVTITYSSGDLLLIAGEVFVLLIASALLLKPFNKILLILFLALTSLDLAWFIYEFGITSFSGCEGSGDFACGLGVILSLLLAPVLVLTLIVLVKLLRK
ncbi:MAG TPA: hypothetical protein VIH52_00945 [Candidatus Nanoarchaeia archaeon]|nr:hypothetical protein [uncultured archaeon]